jgi:hypothetical protein
MYMDDVLIALLCDVIYLLTLFSNSFSGAIVELCRTSIELPSQDGI